MDNVKTVSTSTAQPRTEDTFQEKVVEIDYNSNGEPVGALLFLNKNELEAKGVPPSQNEQVAYCVSPDEGIDLYPPEREVNMGDE